MKIIDLKNSFKFRIQLNILKNVLMETTREKLNY